uniref:WD repeat-containing protein WRAP73 isoform X5 n=1 Tax=Geotrypetes seraphini TaxID=260995 RepID=A0A6P8P9W0_GEOSA|nr:WD repeat-containing protein WRAP73 isoform X5 [Geotrypetes seraphini]
MNFSEVFKVSSQLCRFSPDGRYLASCVQYRLVVRDVSTLQILQLYTCLDQIQHVEWSADSLFILCAMYKRGLIQVWSLEQPDWHCKIDEGSAGLVASFWSPDGRHILNTTEFHLRITVWSLCTKSVSYIKYPKACQQAGVAFTKDGRHMALAERRDCQDYISIFVCSNWQLLRHFGTETQDLAGIDWSPNGCVLAVWDTCLQFKVLLYSLDGRLLSTYSAYEWSLGIKSITWSPSSQFLAIGSYDEKVRILNHVTWKPIAELEHLATINDPKIVVYKEMETCRVFRDGDTSLPTGPNATSSLFNTRSKYNMPHTIWIWDVQKMKLFVVLEQVMEVRFFQWDPRQSRLAICTGSSKVYLWSPTGSVSVQVPTQDSFHVLSLSWHTDGNALLLVSKDHFCLCYLEAEENEK